MLSGRAGDPLPGFASQLNDAVALQRRHGRAAELAGRAALDTPPGCSRVLLLPHLLVALLLLPHRVCAASASASPSPFDPFSEELLVRPTPSGAVVLHWHFSSSSSPGTDPALHSSGFPRPLAEALQAATGAAGSGGGAAWLGASVTRGAWRDAEWGPHPAPAPPGASLAASWPAHANATGAEISSGWAAMAPLAGALLGGGGGCGGGSVGAGLAAASPQRHPLSLGGGPALLSASAPAPGCSAERRAAAMALAALLPCGASHGLAALLPLQPPPRRPRRRGQHQPPPPPPLPRAPPPLHMSLSARADAPGGGAALGAALTMTLVLSRPWPPPPTAWLLGDALPAALLSTGRLGGGGDGGGRGGVGGCAAADANNNASTLTLQLAPAAAGGGAGVGAVGAGAAALGAGLWSVPRDGWAGIRLAPPPAGSGDDGAVDPGAAYAPAPSPVPCPGGGWALWSHLAAGAGGGGGATRAVVLTLARAPGCAPPGCAAAEAGASAAAAAPAPPPPPLRAVLSQQLPGWLRPRWAALAVAVDGGRPAPLAAPPRRRGHRHPLLFAPPTVHPPAGLGDPSAAAAWGLVELPLEVHPCAASVSVSLPFQTRFGPLHTLPPDCERGFDVPPARAAVQRQPGAAGARRPPAPGGGSGGGGGGGGRGCDPARTPLRCGLLAGGAGSGAAARPAPAPAAAAADGGGDQTAAAAGWWVLHSAGLTAPLACPDGSMAFNGPAAAGAAAALVHAAVVAALTRRPGFARRAADAQAALDAAVAAAAAAAAVAAAAAAAGAAPGAAGTEQPRRVRLPARLLRGLLQLLSARPRRLRLGGGPRAAADKEE